MIRHHKKPVFIRETNLQLKYLYQTHPTDTKIVKLFAWKFVNMNPCSCKGILKMYYKLLAIKHSDIFKRLEHTNILYKTMLNGQTKEWMLW